MAVSLYREPERAEEPLEWPALEFHDVFKLFRSGPAETVALRGLDVRIEQEEVVAVLGPSGSGKSTFLQLAAGVDQPSAGEVRAFGVSLGRLGEAALASYRSRDVAIIFQRENLWPSLTAYENLDISLGLAGLNDVRRRAESALARFGLASRAGARAAALSGGEQQRVAIAAAAAREARLVLADEPTGELDAHNEGIVLDALMELRSAYGSTVVVVSHSTRLAEAADRVVELADGRVL